MTTISIRLNDEDKKELEEMCADMGMNISTFYMIYTKKALRDRRIPFDIVAPLDPFYSETNKNYLRKSDQQVKAGRVVEKTIEELEAMED
ncbi:MAG: type II toxin-antitoxin system RelB/DinJ family antitoxin [Lachnospiraceae bacterium]|nr:type II toxin-antitoxin system RelB/DinJ family antitoxin [Lachnospiraceae bacterium]